MNLDQRQSVFLLATGRLVAYMFVQGLNTVCTLHQPLFRRASWGGISKIPSTSV